MRIFARDSLGRVRQMTVGLSTTAIFSVRGSISSETREKPSLLYGKTQSVVSFSVIAK